MVFFSKSINKSIRLVLIWLILLLLLISCNCTKIKFNYDGHIYVKVKKINHQKMNGNFVYDTGAPFFYLDSSFCIDNKIKFIHTQKNKIRGVGNKEKIINSSNDTIIYHVNELKNYTNNTSILDLKKNLGDEIDGLLGVNSFYNKKHKISFTKKKIIFTNNNNGFTKIKIEFKNNQILVPLEIRLNDKKTIKGDFLLDTGSSTTCITSNYKIDTINVAEFKSVGGIGGESGGYTAIAKTINLGNNFIINHPIEISKDSLGALSESYYEGIIGNDILDDFDIIIDLNNEYLFVKPNGQYNNHDPFLFKSFSYIDKTKTHNYWLISYIYLNSDAHKNGLQLNDKIVSVNGVEIEKLDFLKFYRSLKLNQKLEFKIIRNEKTIKINFTLNKFLNGEL